jgi:hypothetical protein
MLKLAAHTEGGKMLYIFGERLMCCEHGHPLEDECTLPHFKTFELAEMRDGAESSEPALQRTRDAANAQAQ